LVAASIKGFVDMTFRTLRGYFAALDEEDDRHVNLTRAYACEIVAWRFAAHLTERDAIDYLLHEEEPRPKTSDEGIEIGRVEPVTQGTTLDQAPTEQTHLLQTPTRSPQRPTLITQDSESLFVHDTFQALAASVHNLNALEIAAVTGAKKFLSQAPIQRVVDGIWKGELILTSTKVTNSLKVTSYSGSH